MTTATRVAQGISIGSGSNQRPTKPIDCLSPRARRGLECVLINEDTQCTCDGLILREAPAVSSQPYCATRWQFSRSRKGRNNAPIDPTSARLDHSGPINPSTLSHMDRPCWPECHSGPIARWQPRRCSLRRVHVARHIRANAWRRMRSAGDLHGANHNLSVQLYSRPTAAAQNSPAAPVNVQAFARDDQRSN